MTHKHDNFASYISYASIMKELKGKYCTDCRVFIDEIEETALGLIQDILDSEAFAGAKIRIMPDTHAGKGIVIGFTSPLSEYINPDHVGVDIGCTIDSWFTGVLADTVDLVRLERDIRSHVKFGMVAHTAPQLDKEDFYCFVQEKMDEWHASWPEMIQSVRIDEKFVSAFCRRMGQDETMFWNSLGTVGGGNHFIEVGADPKKGTLVYTIHCGSRNLGLKIAKYHSRRADNSTSTLKFRQELQSLIDTYKAAGRKKELETAIREFSEHYNSSNPVGYLREEQMSDYLTDMAIGLAYALCNHEVISRMVLDAIRQQNPNAEVVDVVRSIHNYVDFTDHIIRKGAVRSYKGERLVIPFNMRDGVAICRGKSNVDWNCSAPHGAGRVMSRAAAKQNLSVEEFKEQMKDVVSTSVGIGTIDEAPGAYKDTELVMSLIRDTCDIECLIRPIISLKDKNTADLEC